MKLRTKLSLAIVLTFVILVLISVGIVMGFAFARMGQQVQRQLAQHLGSVAELKLGQIGRWLDNAQSHLVTFMAVPQREIRLAAFAGMPPVRDQDYVREQSQINDLMRGFVENQETFQELLVHDVSGRIVGASQPDLVGRRVSDQPYFEASLTEDQVIADFTGGVKPMSAGMILACGETRPMQYMYGRKEGIASVPRLIEFQPRGGQS